MKLKKFWFLLVVLCIVFASIVVLTACGKNKSDSDGSTEVGNESVDSEGGSNAAENEEITPPHTHKMIKFNKVNATCSREGNYSYYLCKDCGKKFEDKAGKTEITNVVIPKNYNHSGGGTVTKNYKSATEEEDGYTGDTYCLACGRKIATGEVIKSLHTHSMTKTEAKAATCTIDGNVEYYTCSKCGKYYTDENGVNEITNVVLPKNDNHIGGTEIRDAKVATEEEEGYTGDTYCLGCYQKIADGEVIKKLDHTHSMTKTEAKAATCTIDGNVEYYTCSKCGKYYTDENGANEITNVVLPKNDNHIGGTEIRDAKVATEEEEGYTGDTYCLGCYQKIADGEVIKKLDHTHSMTKTEAKAATCTADGNVEYYTCSKCGKYYTDENGTNEIALADTVISLTGHNFENRECISCGKKAPSEGLAFALYGTNSYGLEGIGECGDTDIVIPEIYNGLPVTSICWSAFKDCVGITSIEIPDSVTSIEWYAFYGCTSLESIIIPDTVTLIGMYAFENCISLKSATLNGALKIERSAFSGCKSLKSVTLGNKMTYIGDYAFFGCESLADTQLPEKIAYIGVSAFYNCKSLASITLPDKLTYLGESAFSRCSGLKSITISDKLLSIDDDTFAYCENLESVIIGSGVTSIGMYAFQNCTRLKNVIIGSNVEEIIWGAFYTCTGIRNVYYAGSSEDWNKISKGSCNDNLTGATRYYYSEEEPATEGNFWHYDETGKIVVW